MSNRGKKNSRDEEHEHEHEGEEDHEAQTYVWRGWTLRRRRMRVMRMMEWRKR